MIGKLIVWATTRAYAIERMRRVLYEYKITGLKTNLSYLKRIMHNPDFVKGEYNTLFIAKNARMLQRSNGNNEEIENIAMIAAYMDYLMNLEENTSTQLVDTSSYQPLAGVWFTKRCLTDLTGIGYGNTYRKSCGRCDIGQ